MTRSDISSLVVATRGSPLARRQAGIVADLLTGRHPELRVELLVVRTTGDKDRRAFAAIGSKGLFVAEVERAVSEGDADIAVHSAKDLTAELAPKCSIVCVPERASPSDVVVGPEGGTGEERLAVLPPGARVGTSSMRRRALLSETRPDVEVVQLRGNLDTRLRKVADGEADAAILAAAGIERLLGSSDAAPLDPQWWVPAPGQGALAVEARTDRADLRELFDGLSDAAATAELECERAFAAAMEGGCSIPLGCLARVADGHLVATGFVGDPEGGQMLRDRASGPAVDAAALGAELARAMLDAGAADLIASLRPSTAPDPP